MRAIVNWFIIKIQTKPKSKKVVPIKMTDLEETVN